MPKDGNKRPERGSAALGSHNLVTTHNDSHDAGGSFPPASFFWAVPEGTRDVAQSHASSKDSRTRDAAGLCSPRRDYRLLDMDSQPYHRGSLWSHSNGRSADETQHARRPRTPYLDHSARRRWQNCCALTRHASKFVCEIHNVGDPCWLRQAVRRRDR